ncbi:MAG: serine hydrolase domain-containing protein [Bacillota bacterium]|uniref:Serine hydrolase n=2 Tax=Virgibacillus salarius TaxID=447199 RepID=A0A941IAY9_9BACI|nr:serine hydrolase [Virgibacillus salarius]MBR7794760.1 serine hydrolase [Virgibacillus salarius]NAZ07480.1 serine hydrolase [Agaribacter marinus]
MKQLITNKLTEVQEKINYSGTVLVKNERQVLAKIQAGYRNRAEQLPNEMDTKFGIASGCKLFTAIAICQLVQAGKLSFHDHLKDCIGMELPLWDDTITIHQLLTHTAGVPDYFDEEVMDDFEELWKEQPMYHLRQLHDFLPLFHNQPMKLKPGERFHYNNTGYILLGLVIEHISGQEFTAYINDHIFQRANMHDSGYFSFDQLPGQTALGYIDEANGSWRTNHYSLPVRGGADGGAFITVEDMAKLWSSLLNHQLLNRDLTKLLFTPHVHEEGNTYYGYGVWLDKQDDSIFKYHVMGYDPGVNFNACYYPKNDIIFVACSNTSTGSFHVMKELENNL